MQRVGRTGFTLIEMLSAIVVIGILAALLLPALSQAEARAKTAQCANNLHQLGIGLGVILGNNHAYPLYRNRSANYDNKTNWWKQFWFYKLDVEGVGIANPTRKRFGAGVWHCPAQRSPPNDISYGYNAIGHVPVGTPYTNNLGLVNLFGLAGHYRYGANGDVPLAPSAEPEVVDPSETMAIGDTFEGILSFDHWYHFAATSKKWHAYSRHQGHLNVVFCDGHVESPTLQTLFEDNRDAALARWNRDHKRHRDKLGP